MLTKAHPRFHLFYDQELQKLERAENDELVELFMAQNRFFDRLFRSHKREAKQELGTIYQLISLEPDTYKRLQILKKYYFFLIGGFMDRHAQTFSYDRHTLAASVALINVLDEWERVDDFYEGIDVLVDVMLDMVWNQEVPAYNNPIISKFISLVEQRLSKKLTTAYLTDHLQVSRSHLSRLVNEELGMSIPHYVTYKRVQQAAFLLQTTNDSAKTIGQQLQFSSPSYFGVCFKHIYGCTPRQYRMMTAGDHQYR